MRLSNLCGSRCFILALAMMVCLLFLSSNSVYSRPNSVLSTVAPSHSTKHSTATTTTKHSNNGKSKLDPGSEYSLKLTKPRHAPANSTLESNATWFSFPLQPDFATVCNFAANHSLPIIFVKSTVTEFDERNAVRETWGAVARNLKIPVVFLIGQPSDNRTFLKVRQESLNNSDLLMGDYEDIYDHMPLKTLSVLFWYTSIVQRQCFSKRLIFSTDTDVIVFPDNLQRLTKKLSCFEAENSIGGSCWAKAPVKRNEKDKKHFVTRKVWAAETYPEYCSGRYWKVT